MIGTGFRVLIRSNKSKYGFQLGYFGKNRRFCSQIDVQQKFQDEEEQDDFASRFQQEIDNNVKDTLLDVLNKYTQYNDEIQRVDKPLGNINSTTVKKFWDQVQQIEEKTGYDPDEAIMDSFDSAMWERGNLMRSFLLHCLDKFGPLPEIKRMMTMVEEIETQYGKTFIKGEDPQMDADFANKIKNMARELQKQDYISQDYQKFKIQAVQDRLIKAEERAKIAFKRELGRQLGVGESQVLQMFKEKGLDFDQEFARAYQQANQADQKKKKIK